LNTLDVIISPEISNSEKNRAILAVEQLLDLYYEKGQLRGSLEQEEFKELFETNADIFNDIAETGSMISVESYTNQAELYVAETGFPFDLINAKLVSIKINDYEDFTAVVQVVKRSFNKLTTGNVVKSYSPGEKSELNIVIEINSDNYETLITGILGLNSQKNYTSGSSGEYRSSIAEFSASIRPYNTGSVAYSKNTILSDYNPLSVDVAKYSGLGFDLQYSKSINENKTLFWFVQGSFDLSKITTNIEGFNALTNSESSVNDNLIGLAGEEIYSLTSGTGQGVKPIEDLQPGVYRISSIEEGREVLDLFNIQLMLGVSYRFYEDDWNAASIGIGVGPNFVLNRGQNNGSVSGAIRGLKLPEDRENFPSIQQLIDNGILIDEQTVNPDLIDFYGGSIEVNQAIESTSNLSFGLKVSPTFQRKLTYGLGLELGLDYYLGFGSFLKDLGTDDSYRDDNLLFEGELNNGRSASILEDYFHSSSFSRLGLKVGLVFIFE